jgi:hypothetical protein
MLGNGGSEVTNYAIHIRQNDLVYVPELTYCDGASATVIANMQCVIPV